MTGYVKTLVLVTWYVTPTIKEIFGNWKRPNEETSEEEEPMTSKKKKAAFKRQYEESYLGLIWSNMGLSLQVILTSQDRSALYVATG